VAKQDYPEPFAHFGYRSVQPQSELLFENSDLCADTLDYADHRVASLQRLQVGSFAANMEWHYSSDQ
jgi:hypothetical protein